MFLLRIYHCMMLFHLPITVQFLIILLYSPTDDDVISSFSHIECSTM